MIQKKKKGANLLHHANCNYTVLVTDLTDAYFALAFAWANPAMDFVIIASLVLSYSPLRYHHNCVDSVMCFTLTSIVGVFMFTVQRCGGN